MNGQIESTKTTVSNFISQYLEEINKCVEIFLFSEQSTKNQIKYKPKHKLLLTNWKKKPKITNSSRVTLNQSSKSLKIRIGFFSSFYLFSEGLSLPY